MAKNGNGFYAFAREQASKAYSDDVLPSHPD